MSVDGLEAGAQRFMIGLLPDLRGRRPLRLLCIGAHSDDLEIGCGGTVLELLRSRHAVEVTWVVLSAPGERALEARRSAGALLRRASSSRVLVGDFADSVFPSQYAEIKQFLRDIRRQVQPDIVFTHRLEDRHQDHRLAAEVTWNTWRDHLILEYEIAKYEGDLGSPNVYLPVSAALAKRKAGHLIRHFASQRVRSWFDADNFLALMRVRGLECRARSGFAEAFHGRKLLLSAATLGG